MSPRDRIPTFVGVALEFEAIASQDYLDGNNGEGWMGKGREECCAADFAFDELQLWRIKSLG
jgi:hypothetical protein